MADDDVDYDGCDRYDFLIRTKLSTCASHGTLQQITEIVLAKPVFLAWPGSWCWRGGASGWAVSVTAGSGLLAGGSSLRGGEEVARPSVRPSVHPSVDLLGGGGASLLASAAVQRTKELKLNRRRKKKQKDRVRNVVVDKDREKAAEWGGDQVSFAEVRQVRNWRRKME